MNSREVLKYGRDIAGRDNFIGVFPLDKVPQHFETGNSFIVNTQTHNLPGEHWLAVYVGEASIRVFDPMGFYYPAKLVNQLSMGCRKEIIYNRIRFQPPLSNLCGEYCLGWLKTIYKQ
jgi:hypothetical protein